MKIFNFSRDKKNTFIISCLVVPFVAAFAETYADRIFSYVETFFSQPYFSDYEGGKRISFKHKKDSVYFAIDSAPFRVYHDETFYLRKSCKFNIYYKYGFIKSWHITQDFNFLLFLNDRFANWHKTGNYVDLDHYLSDDTEIYFGNQFTCWKEYKYSKNIEQIGSKLTYSIIKIEYKNESSVLTGIHTRFPIYNIVSRIIAE